MFDADYATLIEALLPVERALARRISPTLLSGEERATPHTTPTHSLQTFCALRWNSLSEQLVTSPEFERLVSIGQLKKEAHSALVGSTP